MFYEKLHYYLLNLDDLKNGLLNTVELQIIEIVKMAMRCTVPGQNRSGEGNEIGSFGNVNYGS